jgi:hypothetical protein
MQSAHGIIDEALEGVAPPRAPGTIPWSWRFEAVMNGLAIQALTSEAALDGRQIRDEVIRTLFPGLPMGPEPSADRSERVPVRG